jgi:thiol-disulfide isomerase/thioredoxin
MTYLAIVLIGVLAVANLLLTYGVIRRLRVHTTEISSLRRQGNDIGDDVAAPAGTAVARFAATDEQGRSIGAEVLTGRWLVGFFAPNCMPCKERLPEFVRLAAQRQGGQEGVLAVVVASPAESGEVVGQLRPVARVVVEEHEGAVQKAFGVKGFPAFVRVDDGRVVASDFNLASVVDPDPVLVTP